MFAVDIKKLTKENNNFRTVLHTGIYCQIVAMSIPILGDIGEEVHTQTDQMIFIMSGKGKAILNDEQRTIEEHDVVFVPAGTTHNFINIGDEALKLFTIYAPPAHADGTIHPTKEDAEKEEHQSYQKGGE